MRACTAQPLAQASDSIHVVPALLRDKPSPACVREGVAYVLEITEL